MEGEKRKKGLVVALIILALLVICLAGYIVYDKVLSKDDKTAEKANNEANKEDIKYNTYKTGDMVSVKLNDSTTLDFYVLKDSSEKEEFVTLLAKNNMATSAFNNDFTDGNEYKGSLIESKVKEITADWTNIKEARLITVDEIKATGLTTKEQCGPSEDIVCDKVESPSWISLKNELFWTMTKADNDTSIEYDEGRYVYYVDLDGVITGYIVGYKPGGEWNKNGKHFSNFGVRPVIEISKKYVE